MKLKTLMTNQEAIKFRNENLNVFFNKNVRFASNISSSNIWTVTNLFVQEIDANHSVVRISLMQPPSTHFEVPFADPKDFPIVD